MAGRKGAARLPLELVLNSHCHNSQVPSPERSTSFFLDAKQGKVYADALYCQLAVKQCLNKVHKHAELKETSVGPRQENQLLQVRDQTLQGRETLSMRLGLCMVQLKGRWACVCAVIRLGLPPGRPKGLWAAGHLSSQGTGSFSRGLGPAIITLGDKICI